MSSGLPTRSDTNRAVQPHKMPHKMARSLYFRIQEVEGLYYLCSENKGADQLCGDLTADLRHCFRIMQKQDSHDAAQCDPLYDSISLSGDDDDSDDDDK